MLNYRGSDITEVIYENVLKNEIQVQRKETKKTKLEFCASVSVRDCDIKTQTYWNTNTRQPLQYSGNEIVKIRHYRLVSVCLLVLCLLLLTALTVLCVHFHINNKNLTKDIDQLQTKYIKCDNITKQYEQLIQEKNKLLKYLHDGWNYERRSFYYTSSESKNWSESRRYCREKGADLIVINNKEEQDFVHRMSVGAYIWIGLSDSNDEDRWKWVDGSPLTHSFWMTGEPNKQTKENCVAAYLSAWWDYPCNYISRWICEKSIIK